MPDTLRRASLLLITATALLVGCSGDPGTGPVEVKWDRDVCVRCNMVLSDREHSAQVRYAPTDGSRSQVRKFDDLGCAVLWLDQQSWHTAPGVEIWVTDYRNGQWIDARSAHYVTGRHTSMQYGLGAQAEATAGSLDFAGARDHIYRVEQQFNIHGGNLEHPEPTSPPPIR